MNSIRKLFKTQWKLIAVVSIAAFVLGLMLRPSSDTNSHDEASHNQATTWTCSMHPQIRQPEQGKCPICAMDLIPVVEETGAEELGERQLRLSKTAMTLANVQTSLVERKHVPTAVSLFGKIAIDETRLKSITAWAPGRIEKMHVDYTGAFVNKGDPLVELYSPELFIAQQEYLNALTSSAAPLLNIDDIKRKFALRGILDEQLDEIEKRGTASERMTIYAPISGVVLKRAKSEGQYAQTGSLFYDIADLSSIWIYLDAYEKDLPWITDGQKIDFSTEALPGKTFSGTVDFIEPILDPQSRTVKVRALAPNPGNLLKPGLLVSATISAGLTGKIPLVIPASAPLITGKRAVVYVAVPKKQGVFEGREIGLGERSGDYFVVNDGLSEGDVVVTNGAFKIDSEMQLLAKKSMMSPDGGSAPMQHNHGGETMQSPASSSKESMSASHDSHDLSRKQIEMNDSEKDHSAHQMKTGESEMDHSAPTTAPTSIEFIESLNGIYIAYFDIQDALSHDKADKAKKPIKAFLKDLKKVKKSALSAHVSHWDNLSTSMESAAKQLSSAGNISIARAEFKKLSDALIQAAEMFGISEDLGLKQYHCPMAFNNTGADWLSQKDTVENPYFGDAMFSCGSRVKTFSETKGDKK